MVTSQLVQISRRLCRTMSSLTFSSPVSCVYNPLHYAREPHERYLDRYGEAPGRVVLLGMNPGPFGMVQTGVPFGEVNMVRSWMDIEGIVRRPRLEHPKRPVLGFACERSEVSGARLWGWAKDRYNTPQRFFARFFVINYCPLAFVDDNGRNITPDKLAKSERTALYEICDHALQHSIEALAPKIVVGVGAFARTRAEHALGDSVPIGGILHPSPASPAANRGWQAQAERELATLGIHL